LSQPKYQQHNLTKRRDIWVQERRNCPFKLLRNDYDELFEVGNISEAKTVELSIQYPENPKQFQSTFRQSPFPGLQRSIPRTAKGAEEEDSLVPVRRDEHGLARYSRPQTAAI
jgi:hypothetical protein